MNLKLFMVIINCLILFGAGGMIFANLSILIGFNQHYAASWFKVLAFCLMSFGAVSMLIYIAFNPRSYLP